MTSIQAAIEKSNNSAIVTAAKTPAQAMNALLGGSAIKKMVADTCGKSAGQFTASVLDLYTSEKLLHKCAPHQVFMECMKAASLNLPINKQLGFAYIVPYGSTATMIIGYKGLIQLAMRTGQYKYINADVVYEGEFEGEDRLSGRVELNGERTSDKVVGFFAYFKLINGYEKTLYWSLDKLKSHARKFSKSYQQNANIWREHFEEMAVKTVLRNLLTKWAPMTIEMASIIQGDELVEEASGDEAPEIINPDDYEIIGQGEKNEQL